ncbi:redox-active disulfide protein 2 [Winogradskyella sp. PE311]|uniref:redox-active disulfide protein 2 n=1 Tax=Winogradskyella sp. PE311 TaxID=3366943 RepID=UPI00397EC62B
MDLKDKSTEKLKGELKGLKMITGVLIGVLGLLFIVCVYGLITKEDNSTFTALIVVPLALSAIIPLNYGNMKKIKKELESRNQ